MTCIARKNLLAYALGVSDCKEEHLPSVRKHTSLLFENNTPLRLLTRRTAQVVTKTKVATAQKQAELLGKESVREGKKGRSKKKMKHKPCSCSVNSRQGAPKKETYGSCMQSGAQFL